MRRANRGAPILASSWDHRDKRLVAKAQLRRTDTKWCCNVVSLGVSTEMEHTPSDGGCPLRIVLAPEDDGYRMHCMKYDELLAALAQIADDIDCWFLSGAVDDGNLTSDLLPEGLKTFVAARRASLQQ